MKELHKLSKSSLLLSSMSESFKNSDYHLFFFFIHLKHQIISCILILTFLFYQFFYSLFLCLLLCFIFFHYLNLCIKNSDKINFQILIINNKID